MCENAKFFKICTEKLKNILKIKNIVKLDVTVIIEASAEVLHIVCVI